MLFVQGVYNVAKRKARDTVSHFSSIFVLETILIYDDAIKKGEKYLSLPSGFWSGHVLEIWSTCRGSIRIKHPNPMVMSFALKKSEEQIILS